MSNMKGPGIFLAQFVNDLLSRSHFSSSSQLGSQLSTDLRTHGRPHLPLSLLLSRSSRSQLHLRSQLPWR